MKVIIIITLIILLIFIIVLLSLRQIGKAEEEFYEYQREYEEY